MQIHRPASLAISILLTSLCAAGESYKEPDYPGPECEVAMVKGALLFQPS
jgi:hypothetical protein